MNKNKHLLLEERIIIEQRLNERESFKSIGRELLKDPTTIAKEVKNHIKFKKTGCYGKPFNNCLFRKNCTAQHLCGNMKCNRYCLFCNSHPCSSLCPDYHQEVCENLTFQSVIDIINRLYLELSPSIFCCLFQVLLGDNGSEFSNPTALEKNQQGYYRTRVFYCDPQAPYQKGAAENNHTLIRRIIPKGTLLDHFSQVDITLMMNHINFYARPNLGDKTPYEVFASLYGEPLLKRMGAELIVPDKVTLHPFLLKK